MQKGTYHLEVQLNELRKYIIKKEQIHRYDDNNNQNGEGKQNMNTHFPSE